MHIAKYQLDLSKIKFKVADCFVNYMVNDNIKIPFGTKLGEIVHISEIESGLTCGCNCLGCGGALVARKGNETTHHFGHHVFVGCKGGIESALHLFAKRAISTAGYLKVPPIL